MSRLEMIVGENTRSSNNWFVSEVTYEVTETLK